MTRQKQKSLSIPWLFFLNRAWQAVRSIRSYWHRQLPLSPPRPPPPRHEGTIYDQDRASAHSTGRLKAAASGKHKSRLTGHHHAAGPGIHGTRVGSARVRLRGSEAGPRVPGSGWDACGPTTPQHLGAAERLKT